MELNDLPVLRSHRLNVNGMRDWGIDMDSCHDLLAVTQAERMSERSVNLYQLNILIPRRYSSTFAAYWGRSSSFARHACPAEKDGSLVGG